MLNINKSLRIDYKTGNTLVSNVLSNVSSSYIHSTFIYDYYVWRLHLIDELLNDINLSEFTYIEAGIGLLNDGTFLVNATNIQDTSLWNEADLSVGKIVCKTDLYSQDLVNHINSNTFYLQVIGSVDNINWVSLCVTQLNINDTIYNPSDLDYSSTSSSGYIVIDTSSESSTSSSSSSSSESSEFAPVYARFSGTIDPSFNPTNVYYYISENIYENWYYSDLFRIEPKGDGKMKLYRLQTDTGDIAIWEKDDDTTPIGTYYASFGWARDEVYVTKIPY